MMSAPKKTVLITGTSSGIGEALAREFHSQGFRVFATARSASKISFLADAGIEALSLEVNDPASVAALRDEVSRRTGGTLDYLVNNAGRNYTMLALDIDFDEVRDVFETNVVAVMRMCKEFAPLLIAAKGTIVQTGSLAGVMPYFASPVYNASKAALHAYTDTLRVELSQFDVKVINLVTGGVKSELSRVERTLPPDSYYMPINDEFTRRVKYSQDVGMPADAFAKKAVRKILGRGLFSYVWALLTLGNSRRWIWEGTKTGQVWFMVRIMPKAFAEWIFTRMFNLKKLRGTADKKLS